MPVISVYPLFLLCSQRDPLLVEKSFQSLEALPVEHLQIVFVASSSCSEDDAPAASTTTTASTTACQQKSAVNTISTLANGNVSTAQPRVQDVKPKPSRVSSKTTKKVIVKVRERSKRVESERKTREEVDDVPPDGWPLRRVISIEEDHLPHLLQGEPQLLLHQLSEEGDEEDAHSDTQSSAVVGTDLIVMPPTRHITVATETRSVTKSHFKRVKKTSLSPRGQPVGKENQPVSSQR